MSDDLTDTMKVLIEAYYRGRDYSESRIKSEVESQAYAHSQFGTMAKALGEMGYAIQRTGPGTITGRQIAGDAVLRIVEKLLEDAKATLETLEKQPDQAANKKLITQWRFVLNALQGAPHKRGLLPDLKEAGPGAY